MGSGVATHVSKQEKERQRKERQKQRKLVELDSALQNALDVLSQAGPRWVHTQSRVRESPCRCLYVPEAEVAMQFRIDCV